MIRRKQSCCFELHCSTTPLLQFLIMHLPSLIEKKRDGGELGSEEIAQVSSGFTRGEIPDYQMSALAMAIFFRGMSDMETWDLTKAMLESGQIFEYPPNSPPKVDKHSTGAIGGKTSLVLAPLLACDELWVPMISGRGLDITGGTLDKLESIPGFNVNLDRTRAIKQLERIGVFIGKSDPITPAKLLRWTRKRSDAPHSCLAEAGNK